MPHDPSDPLRVLPREIEPPAALRERVTATLRARRVLRPRSRTTLLAAALAAAAVLVFVIGRWSGSGKPQSSDARSEYALLLYQDANFLDHPKGTPSYYGEYSAWARSLKNRGLLVVDRALDSTSTMLHRLDGGVRAELREVATDAGRMTGLFIIRAADSAEAMAIARTCPHLRHGGIIAVRSIFRGP